jgi:hypothetical protein
MRSLRAALTPTETTPQSRNQFKAADHSDHLVGTDDRELRNFAHIHFGNDVVDGGILADAKGIRGHNRGDTKRTHAFPDASTLLNAQKRLEPVAGRIDAKFIAVKEISFRHDPHKATLIIENGKPPLIGLKRQARGINERRAQLHSCKRGSHDIGGAHD